MDIKVKDDTLEVIKTFKFPTYNEIPDVGLYLEQTSKYVNEIVEPLVKTELTGSMISNYVKKKIIENPVKKLYYRQQISELIFIALAKVVMPLENIKKLLILAEEKAGPQKSYVTFCRIFEATLRSVFFLEVEENIIPDEKEGEMRTLLRYMVTAVVFKIYLDSCFE